MDIFFTLLALIISFIITFIAIPPIIYISRAKGLMDSQDEPHKIHNGKIPNLGGIGLFGGFMISFCITIGFHLPSYLPSMIASLIILFFIGLKDDVFKIDWFKKLIGQIIAASIIVIIGGIHIPGLDGLFGIYNFPEYSGMLFSIFSIIIIMNAFNLIDGIDGLAGMISIVVSLVFGIWFLVGGHYAESVLCFSLAGSLIAFVYFNFEPAKIFLGDSGSLMIGFVLSVSAFRIMQLNGSTSGLILDAPAIFALSVMIVPMFDTFRIIVLRISRGFSPFCSDKNHIHHYMLKWGFKHYQIALILTSFNLTVVIISFFINSWNPHIYLLTILFLGILILPIIKGLNKLWIGYSASY